MSGIKINEGLFDGVEYFESPQRRRELVEFFQFEKRRVILGQNALDTLGEECRRLDAGRIVLVRDPGIAALEALVRPVLEAAGIDDWQRTYQMAYGLLANPSARDAFDVTRESEATRQRYGYTHFGQSALVARRLIEARVPFVQLNWSQTVEAITPH